MSTNPIYIFHQDPGHGWLEVPKMDLINSGVGREITPYSYQKEDRVYLEEDCDAPCFLAAIKKRGVSPSIVESVSNEDSPIRKYNRFKP